jgi:hypothetical protein
MLFLFVRKIRWFVALCMDYIFFNSGKKWVGRKEPWNMRTFYWNGLRLSLLLSR